MSQEAQISEQEGIYMEEDTVSTGSSPTIPSGQAGRSSSRSPVRRRPSSTHVGPVRAGIAKFSSQRSRSVSPALSRPETKHFTAAVTESQQLARQAVDAASQVKQSLESAIQHTSAVSQHRISELAGATTSEIQSMAQTQSALRAQLEAQQKETAELRAKLAEMQIMSGSQAENVAKGQEELTQSTRQKFFAMDQQLQILQEERDTESSRRQMLELELQALRASKDNIAATTQSQIQKMFQQLSVLQEDLERERQSRSSLQADLQQEREARSTLQADLQQEREARSTLASDFLQYKDSKEPLYDNEVTFGGDVADSNIPMTSEAQTEDIPPMERQPPMTFPIFPTAGGSDTGGAGGHQPPTPRIPMSMGADFTYRPQQTVVISNQLKLKEPPIFYGKVEEDVFTWTQSVSDYLDVGQYTEAQRVAFTITYLQGSAREWWHAYLRQRHGVKPAQFSMLRSALEQRFGSRMREQTARAQLRTIFQKSGETVRAYGARFLVLLGRLPSYDDEWARDTFASGLPTHISELLLLSQTHTLEDMIAQAERIELTHKYAQQSRVASGGRGGGSRGQTGSDQQQTPLFRGGRGGRRGWGRRGGGRGGQIFPQSTETGPTSSIDGRRCYVCGGRGHFAAACPSGRSRSGGGRTGGRRPAGHGRGRFGRRNAAMVGPETISGAQGSAHTELSVIPSTDPSTSHSQPREQGN